MSALNIHSTAIGQKNTSFCREPALARHQLARFQHVGSRIRKWEKRHEAETKMSSHGHYKLLDERVFVLQYFAGFPSRGRSIA